MIPVAAVALIEAADAVLLIRRPVHAGDPWSGQWALPGGRSAPGDADSLATARRELAEEVGVALDGDGWATLAVQIAGRHTGHGVPVAPFHRRLSERPPLTVAPREVAASRWLDLTLLDDPARRRTGIVPGGGDRVWPYLDIGDTPLWGFTWRVLAAWRGIPAE